MLKNFREKDIKPISPQKVSTFEKASLLVLFTFATLIMGPAFIMAANLTNGLLPYTVNGVNGLMGDSGFGWNNSTNTASIQGSNGVASMLQWMNSDRTGYENETVNPTPGNSVIYLPTSNEVGISDTQTITNKNLSSLTNTFPSFITNVNWNQIQGNINAGNWVSSGPFLNRGAINWNDLVNYTSNVNWGGAMSSPQGNFNGSGNAIQNIGICTAHTGTDACIGTNGCLGYCTAGTFPNCSTCTCC